MLLRAQTPVRTADLSVPSKIAPAYFGPNAFPVPDGLFMRPSPTLRAEVAGNYFKGHLADGQDHTWAPSIYVEVPLWTHRVSLSVYGQVHEWYQMSPSVAEARRLSPEQAGTGNDSGDLYFATNILVLEEKGWRPDIMIRGALKTASGDHFGRARHYDAPGYHFDLIASKSYTFPEGSFVRKLQGGLNFGWLYWQTDNGRQNDARLYGVIGMVDTLIARLSAQWGSYWGWERDGDTPSVMKIRLDAHISRHFEAFFYFQHGFRDWPFTQYRLGLACNLDLWNIKKSSSSSTGK